MAGPNLFERIVSTFTEMVLRQGVRSLTMDEVATCLGISKKTLYQHFCKKEDLVTAAVRHHNLFMQARYEDIKQRATDPIEQIMSCVVCDFELIQTINPNLPLEIKRYFPAAWQAMEEFDHGYLVAYLRNNLTWGQREGYYLPELDPDVTVLFQVAAVNSVISSDMFPPSRYGLHFHQLILHAEFMYIRGIVTDKGRERFTYWLSKQTLSNL